MTRISDKRRVILLPMSIQKFAVIGSLLPGFACYLCVAYTYIFQSEFVSNFTAPGCQQAKSGFMSLSYSITVMQPQTQFWLIIMFGSLPIRFLFTLAEKGKRK
ncbi:hypothetical protein AB6A40_008936 [Gnathostoma spinigerum]|uniref:Uncharacterized protein n=1 Tax=Gnathostoma spinigerum TaxID=75299 RepID=A0ABD6ESW9_9BILA